ncbi:hypothetical protein [Ignicoccus islandicus]|nr:hypothetical protein [Ignicoccus islandicus]
MSVRYDNVVIDPSASLAPRRFGLPPHPLEWEELVNAAKRIVRALDGSDVVIITHYHRDHYNPGWLYDNSILDGKILIIKDYKRFINVSQKIRAYKFLKQLQEKRVNVRIEIADNSLMEVSSHIFKFSPPLPHGDSERLGYVVAVEIDGEFAFSSDIQGGPLDVHDWLVKSEAKTVVIDGPPLYLSRIKVDDSHFKLINILGGRAIVDHHIARIKEWRKFLKFKVKAFNDVLAIPEKLLEAKRDELYENYPVEDSWFKLSFSEMRSLYFPVR